jgi:hypothetical protein
VDIDFRVTGKQPELWDATTGSTRKLPQYSEVGNATRVPLHFEPAQSFFIVFSDAGVPKENSDNFPSGVIAQELKSAWTVSFDAAKRGPATETIFTALQDWSLHTNDSIKYYSGTALYKNTFQGFTPAPGERIYLDLGNVRNLARIKIDGQLVGGLWTAPWQIDITDFVSGGVKQLEVEVVNLWVNRLIGDSRLPPDKRPTWLANNFFTPQDPLQQSGLLGPVTIKRIRY